MSKVLDHINVDVTTIDELEREINIRFVMGAKIKIKIPVEVKLQGLEEQVIDNVVNGSKKKLEAAIKEMCTEEDDKPRIVVPGGR